MIYIYGDSHARNSFKNLAMIHECREENSVTMHRVGRDKAVPNWKESTSDDTSVFVYGEVDCRAHVGKQIDLGRRESDVIDILVGEYMDTLCKVVKAGRVVVVAIIPPTTNHEYLAEVVDGGFPFVSSDADRVRYTQRINIELEAACARNHFTFFNPYARYTREDGCLRRELSDRNVHVGNSTYVLELFQHVV
jgi:hypothetical protein